MSEPLLQVTNLRTYIPLREGIVRAVDGASFAVQNGQTVGVVGESGCGKSMTARSILRIVPRPGSIVDGEILLHRKVGERTTETVDLAQLDPRGETIRQIRGAEIAMIFQEPMASFSPVHTIGFQIIEGILLHRDVTRKDARTLAIETLKLAGMPQPARTVDDYPHELSGGMRQRAMIAMALSCSPSLLIADEPTTALDVTTQAQILTLMHQLQAELGMAILFITHDLGVIAKMTRHVIVMYLGQVIESAPVEALFTEPKHPYTEALLHSIPQLGRRTGQRLTVIPGGVPDPFSRPSGCPYHPRCHKAIPGVCDVQEPPEIELASGHFVRCVLYS